VSLGRLARGRARRWTLLSLGITAAIALIDALVAESAILIGLLIIGPLVSSARSGPRGVLAVSAFAVALGVFLGVPDGVFGSGEHVLRISIVVAGSLLAIWTASIRQSRERTAELLGTQAAVARRLAASDTLEEAGPHILEAVSATLGWDAGAIWHVRRRRGTIECVQTWASGDSDASAFAEQSRGLAFARGEGLPGGVWASGEPAWVLDVEIDSTFPRSAATLAAGLRSGLCFPIRSSGEIVGALEFWSLAERRPDRYVLDLMDAVGGQVGEYVERKRAEAAVQESEARKRAILDAALDCVITMDAEGRVLEFNPAAERTFGYSAEEAVGAELASLIIPPALRDRHRTGLSRVIRTGKGDLLNRRLELTGMRKDGSEFPVELTLTAIGGGDTPLVFAGYIRDLTEIKRGEDVQRRLALIVESSEDAILSKDRNAIVTSWNSGAQRLYGWTPEEAIGQSIRLIIPEERKNEERKILEAVLRDERIERYETIRVRKDGTRVDVALSISPIKNADGEIVGASVIAHNNSEQKRIEEQRVRLLQMEQESRLQMQQAERRASFLAEAQALLGSSLDYTTTLENLARLSVPYISDWCIVDVVNADGKMERLATAHLDPEKEALAAELRRRYPHTDLERGAEEAIAVGRSTLVGRISDEQLARAAHDEEHLAILRDLGFQSGMIVPLRARERSMGAITFLSAESGRQFDEEDLALAEDLANRAAIAVDNARLYGERSYIASTLQQALLPDNLPEIPGVELAARYVAAGEGTEVGGDFYDIYRSGEATWGLAIGDVRGKGPRAAAVTALTRYTLRAAALSQTTPSQILMTLNEAMLRQRSDDRFCTVAYASIEPSDSGGISMRLGVGGHPLPLLIRRDGSVDRVGRPGTLIGLVSDPDIVDVTLELSPGESLVLYTDGVSEARSQEDGLFGEERLIELLRDCATQDAAFIAERIEQRVREFQDMANADDLAVLVMRVRERSRSTGERSAERFAPVKRPAPA
jgi:PAS domain S-box-containing protein